MSERSLPDHQRMARVNVAEVRWEEFRQLAKTKKRSVADYLGRLVDKELNRAQRTEDRRAARVATEPTTEPVEEMWIPPWEE
jgi:hypothetical protein